MTLYKSITVDAVYLLNTHPLTDRDDKVFSVRRVQVSRGVWYWCINTERLILTITTCSFPDWFSYEKMDSCVLGIFSLNTIIAIRLHSGTSDWTGAYKLWLCGSWSLMWWERNAEVGLAVTAWSWKKEERRHPAWQGEMGTDQFYKFALVCAQFWYSIGGRCQPGFTLYQVRMRQSSSQT